MQDKSIAIIPARGGSKRCPNKNLAFFKNKPLVAHTIEQAIDSKIFERIIVTSDNTDILNEAKKYDIEIDFRGNNLSKDKSPLIDVIRNIIKKYEINDNTIIALLLVTGPLREISDIVEAYKLFLSSDKGNSVVSVTANENPVEMNWRLTSGHLEPYMPQWNLKTTRKQDFDTSYRYNDAVILDTAKNFQDTTRTLFGNSPIPYIMPPERSINIDYEFQLNLVKLIGKFQQSKK